MKKIFKFYFLIMLFLLSSVISWNLYFKVYLQEDRINIHLFPKQIAGWLAEEMLITEEEYAILETRNVFSRRYKSSTGDEVYLFIVYSENNRKVSHPPEICYTGGGATVAGRRRAQLKNEAARMTVDTNKLSLEFGNAQQIVHYWFKVGDTFTPNYWKQQILIAVKTFLGQPSSSALIRLSTVVVDSNTEQADKRIQEFSKNLLLEIPKYLP